MCCRLQFWLSPRVVVSAYVAFVLLFAASDGLAWAQAASGRITGTVVDAATGQPLERVLVSVDGAGRTVTDAEGRFELPGLPRASVRVAVSVVGYILVQRSVDLRNGDALDLRIPLTEGTGTYTENVTVTADVFRSAEPGVPAQQTLGSADLQNLRGVLADDPLRAVQTLPGVASGDDLRSEFSVRGSDFGHINFTVEGFPTPYLLHTVRAVEDRASSGSVAMINSDVLEGVTLLNGGYAQRFGNRTGAEVDFRLREGSRSRSQLRGAVSGTSASIVVEGPIGRARDGARGSWILSARKSYLDLLIDRLTDEGIAFGFVDAQGKAVYDLTSRQRIELAVVGGRSRLEESADEIDSNDLHIGRNASAVAVGTWRLTAPRGVVTARALAATNEFENVTLEAVRLDEGAGRQLAIRTDATWLARRGLQVEGGAQIERADEQRRRQRATGPTTFRVINDFDARGTRTGAYAQLRWDPVRALTLVPGGRFDRWTMTGQQTASPWLQAEWRIGAETKVRAGGGVYRQFAEFEHVTGTLGTAPLEPERATHADVSIERRLTPSLRAAVTVYHRAEDGFIRRPAGETRFVDGRLLRGSLTAPYATRLGGTARGVEVFVQRRDPNGLSGWLAYSYGRQRFDDVVSGETFWGDLDQRHALNAYVSLRLSARSNIGAKLRTGTNFPAPGYYRAEGDTYFVSDRRNEVRLPFYARLDVRASRTFHWPRQRLTLFGEVMNVLNRDNVRYQPPSIDSRTGRASRLFESLIPIVPSAGLLIEF